ncbi:hypothetical protein [uncultured Mediterranean phage uvMED]|mgnify:CR=1 FL=1|nr:hypothetical protein [uncultured Mediterranean phage uvMED]
MYRQTFKTDLEAVQFMIHQSGSSSWTLEKITGISRQTIDRWIKADTLNIRRIAINTFAKHLKYQIEHNKDGVAVQLRNKKRKRTEMELLEDELHAHVETQKMLIQMQAKRIKQLEDKLQLYEQDNHKRN